MKLVAVLVVLFHFTAIAAGAPPGKFDGTWHADFLGVAGADRTGTLVIDGSGGRWKMGVKSKNNPCVGLDVPIAIQRKSDLAITFMVVRSTVVEGCKDTVMALTAGDGERLRGNLNGRPVEFTRTAAHEAPAAAPQPAIDSEIARPVPAPTKSSPPGAASSRAKPSSIQMVYFGDNDCPPCVAWRGMELPKLRETAVFKTVEFTHVYKTVMSPVPAEGFLPEPLKPFKKKLDVASGQNRGSSQTAIIVDGEIFDYYHGNRDANDIAQRLEAIQRGGSYPFERCLEYINGFRNTRNQCIRSVAPT